MVRIVYVCVCVCERDQHTKRMLQRSGINVDYKDLLELTACDLEEYNCIWGFVYTVLTVKCEKEELEDMEKNISYKQWTAWTGQTLA